MKHILLTLASVILLIAALGLIQGCSESENPVESVVTVVPDNNSGDDTDVLSSDDGKDGIPSMALSSATWPTSMSHFKFPFRGVYNNYHAGEIWKITCGYGCGLHKNTWYLSAAYHSIDLVRDDGGSTYGSYVLAPARGKVIYSGWKSGYGWCVIMDHDAGRTSQGYKSIVAHLAYNPYTHVRSGDDLLQGTVLGKCGSSGGNWVAHIHFSVWKYGRSVPLNGISGGPSLVVGGRYYSGNSLVPPPRGW